MDLGVGPFGRIHYFSRTLVENRVIVSLHPNANDFLCLGHRVTHFSCKRQLLRESQATHAIAPRLFAAHLAADRGGSNFAKRLNL